MDMNLIYDATEIGVRNTLDTLIKAYEEEGPLVCIELMFDMKKLVESGDLRGYISGEKPIPKEYMHAFKS